MNKKTLFTTLTTLLFIPFVGIAIDFTQLPTGNQDYSNSIGWILNQIFNFIIWPIVILVVIILFIMAGFSFLTSKGEPGKLDQARNFLIWGIIGVVVILISFSIVATVKNIIGIT